MALGAHAVAAPRLQLRRVDYISRARRQHVAGAGTMTSLAADAGRPKGRAPVPVSCPRHGLKPAGVAIQALRLDSTTQIGTAFRFVAGRQVPSRRPSIPGNWRLKQKSLLAPEEASGGAAGPDEEIHYPVFLNLERVVASD